MWLYIHKQVRRATRQRAGIPLNQQQDISDCRDRFIIIPLLIISICVCAHN